MKIKHFLAGTAIASLALVAEAGLPLGIPFATQAEAAVSVSFSLFYDELEPHGDWVRYRDAYVFIPAEVDDGWRPYTEGHWVYARRYGWTWVSDEPFGWATYHYGRWGYADDIGWYWVPGTRWAPAWVSWRRSNDHIVWAPLPPSRGADISVSITVGDIPDFYWVAVPARQFLAPDIQVVVINEDREFRRVIERTEFLGAPRVTNNIVVNNVIDVDVVTQVTGQEVKTVEVRETDDPRQAKATAEQVTVFEGEVEADEKAKPKEVREASEVKKVKRGGKAGEAAGTEPIPEPDADTGSATAPAVDTEQPAADAGNGSEQPPAAAAEQAPADTGNSSEQPPKATAEQPPEDTGNAPEQPPAASAEQPSAPKEDKQQRAKKAEEEPVDDATGTTTAPEPEQPAKGEGEGEGQGKANAGKQKQGQDKKDCDPADPECQPQQ